MEITDLMLNDYIMIHCFDGSDIVIKVTEIEGEGCTVYGISKQGSHWSYIEDVRPISLTPEILEKIGFESQHNVGYVLEYYDDYTIIVDLWNHTLKILMNYKVIFEKEYFDTIPLQELQHALKLCGVKHAITI